MKNVFSPGLVLALFLVCANVSAQQLYTESSAVSTVNESNSIGSATVFNGSPTIALSNESDTGSHSILLTNTNNNTYGRYRLQVPVTNGEQIRVIIKFKTENEAGTGHGNGFVWIEQGIPTNTWAPSSQTGWQVFDETVTPNASVIGLTFGPTQQSTSVDKIWIDEVSVTSVNSPDTQSPTAPTLSSTGKTATTVDLSWTAATDNVGVTQYKVYRDNALIATLGNVTTYQMTGLTANTAYSFTVTALDAAGNEGSASNALSVTTDASSGGGGSGGSVWTESSSVASYSGNVAIGTASVPSGYKMAVDGKLITEEVRVQLSGNWPDYVFEKDYNLPTLEEIQEHIKEKGHLPNIPSAKEVERNGIELGEMDRLLLEKIEEMMLYIIELKKENKAQQIEIQNLKN